MNEVRRILIVHSANSTRAKKYKLVYRAIQKIAVNNNQTIKEIELNDVGYFAAVELIKNEIEPTDLVVAAGGDGIAQATFQAVYESKLDVAYTTIPLGNSNDISRAFNRRRRSADIILNQPAREFYPLKIMTDNRKSLIIASYITFGATTVLVDYLNQKSCRRNRKILKALSPAAALPVNKLGEISSKINELEFPDFYRNNKLITDDSVGFFLLPAAHNVLRLPKDIRLAASEFFFHYAAVKNKDIAQKIFMAGKWSLHFPGEMTELEELKFVNNNTNIIANISGDNIDLGKVSKITAIRSLRPIKILCKD